MIRKALLATALALATLAGATSAAALVSRPDAPLPAADDVTVALDLLSYGPSVLTPADELRTTATVANPTALSMSDVFVNMSVTRAPIQSSAALQRFLDDPASSPVRLAASNPIGGAGLTVSGTGNALPPGGTVTVDLAATPDTLGFKAGTSGVFGIVISVTGPTGILATRPAVVTWYDAPITQLRLAFVATASGSPERVTQVTSAASVTGAALAIDPVMVTDASQGTALTSGREVFGLPSENPDIASLAHAKDTALIHFALKDAEENTVEALQDLPWLATMPVVDAPTVTFAAAHGATAGILDVTGGARLDVDAPVVDVKAGGDTLAVVVPNRQLSEVLATYRPGKPDAAARLVAEAALIAQHGDGVTPVVVAPGEAWELTGPGVSMPVSDLLGAPWVAPVSVRSVIGGLARASMTAPDLLGTDEDLGPDLIKALTRQLDDIAQLSKTAEEPNAVYLPGGRQVLAPLAVGLRADPDARTATYTATRDSVDALLSSLYVAEGSDVNLIAASGNVPVTLHNDLSVPSTVTVVMKSTSPNLVVQDRPVVTIPAGGDVVAHVAVTGVKSANVTATVALENANGDVVAAPQVLRVRVRADWGNAVTAVFTAGLALLLIAGLIRTVRRGRRSSRMAPVSAATAAPPPTPAPPGDTDAGGDDD